MSANKLADSNDTSSERDTTDRRVPLVILGGFLGAGKTTVLNHLLRQAKGRRIAALVNDVGEVNIDAALTRSVAQVDSGSADGIVELSNGCICCGIQDAFGEAVVNLAKRNPDGIVVEATGIAEPQRIISSLAASGANGKSALDYACIQNVVSIVDASWWIKQVQATFRPVRRPLLLLSDPRRPLSELLSMQVECANLVILNKVDLADSDSIGRSRAALSALNPRAEVLLASQGQVEFEQVFEVARFDLQTAMKASDLELESNDRSSDKDRTRKRDQGHDHGDFGLASFVFRARLPIIEEKLLAFLRGETPGLLRAKGFVWTDRKPDRVGYLSLAGDTLRFDHLGKWMHALVKSGEMDRSRIPAEVWRKWDLKTGDRRQELVFIGIDLDREAIENELTNMLQDLENL